MVMAQVSVDDLLAGEASSRDAGLHRVSRMGDCSRSRTDRGHRHAGELDRPIGGDILRKLEVIELPKTMHDPHYAAGS